ncbi:MAG: zinc carboxypeptidase [Phaeodactylibacter sp.]|nr:zinc carboxypeptidase [Phaeodactylibacter sp.]MCB9048914.1 zinc carboxypeptidase [Lewinellaceae bacterium]
MKKLLHLALLLAAFSLNAQRQPLTYYLPDIEYDPAIPTPESFLGYQIGEWHLSHDQQLFYMRALAAASPRVTLTEYARTYENRPLVYLTITSEANHGRLEQIRREHLSLSNPGQSAKADISSMPTVLYQGFSIHGNEPSGGNAAPLVAYYLAAGKSAEVQRILEETVILLDPCFNPDGFNRFSTWANMHKNQNLTDDPQDREYNEAWPRGRTNHYWFDLNRDWMPGQHPESQGRIRLFHEWKPNILTDHHEMGTNATFFFMPGVPERTNPITPWENQELTGKIGTYHAAALDAIGSLYYSQEGYDDFYYGKGSTFPDANGGIGILFEQASSRGHLQATVNGPLSFAFTIRNQVTTALSTQNAAVGLRTELLDYQRRFYRQAMEEAAKDARKALVFGVANDPARLHALVELLRRQQVEVYQLSKPLELDGQSFLPESAFIVPMEQTQYRLIRGIFDTTTTFKDSIFYDVSSWALHLAFNLDYAEVGVKAYSKSLLGPAVQGLAPERKSSPPPMSQYAYLLEWEDYYAPRALNKLLSSGLRAKVATRDFKLEGREYRKGTVLIPAQNQSKSAAQVYQLVAQTVNETLVSIQAVSTGFTPTGIDLGSNDFEALKPPKILILIGDGVSSYGAGEVWHLLDQRFGMKVSKMEVNGLSGSNLDKYTVIIMPDGSYNGVSKEGWDKLREWAAQGGTLITLEEAAKAAQKQGLASLKVREEPKKEGDTVQRRPYERLEDDRGSESVGGAIVLARVDLSHPLFYGCHRPLMPLFRSNSLSFEPTLNAYATPAVYTDTPLVSGYIKDKNLQLIRNSAAAVVSGVGQGRTICLMDNPNFRAFWYGTNRIFANSIFFGSIISRYAVEKASGQAPAAVK